MEPAEKEALVNAGGRKTEWKVRIASLATFVGSLALGILFEVERPGIIERLPDNLQVVGGALLVAAASWFSGRAARSRPEYISQSTVDAVREAIRARR